MGIWDRAFGGSETGDGREVNWGVEMIGGRVGWRMAGVGRCGEFERIMKR